jgi:multidrug efflux pump subunit AcrA (membrane-fusion protein)
VTGPSSSDNLLPSVHRDDGEPAIAARKEPLPDISRALPSPVRSQRRTRRLIGLALVVALAGAAAMYGVYSRRLHSVPRTDLLIHVVRREPLQLTIVERGGLESADNRDVICRVKAGTKGSTVASQIKWVIDDGSHVKQSDVLVELDDSGLQEQLKTEKITVDGARAASIQAEENYKIVQSQNESDIQSAKIAIDLARLDLEKYLDGEYPQTRKDILGRMKMAESDKDMQQDRAAWASRMVKKGYLTSSQADAEVSRLQSNDIALKKVQEELRVLDDYTKKRTETDLHSKLDEAKRALERVEKQALAKDVQADTDRQSKKSIYEQELARYQEIEDEIRKCTITAPQDGMVVYYISDQARFGGGSQQSIVAQGEPVREGQKLMRIPDLKHMLVNTKVHEALVSRVRGEQLSPTGFGELLRAALLVNSDVWSNVACQYAYVELREKFRDKEQRVVYAGQQALIRVDSFPDMILHGHVKSVATISAQQDWLASDVKVYQTMVAIDDPLDGLKPGMSAEVTIVVDTEQEPVLTLPLQAIIGSAELGKYRKCFVVTAGRETVEREIIIGLSNEKVAEVKSGLAEGEEVVLNPRVILGEKQSAGGEGTVTSPDKPQTGPTSTSPGTAGTSNSAARH